MKRKILSRIYDYKYQGDYLNNYKDLISIIQDVTKNILTEDLIDIGIHLVLESRNHRWGMYYSKAFEMATKLQNEIKIAVSELINKLPNELVPALTFINEKTPMSKSQLETNPNDSWILYANPWNFYIIETKDSAKLIINDFDKDLRVEIKTDDYFNWKLKNEEKAPYELIYSEIIEYIKKDWMKKASAQQCITAITTDSTSPESNRNC